METSKFALLFKVDNCLTLSVEESTEVGSLVTLVGLPSSEEYLQDLSVFEELAKHFPTHSLISRMLSGATNMGLLFHFGIGSYSSRINS